MRENKFEGWKAVYMEHALGETEPIKTNHLQYVEMYVIAEKVSLLLTRRNTRRWHDNASERWFKILTQIIRNKKILVHALPDGWVATL